MLRSPYKLMIVVLLASNGWIVPVVRGQEAGPQDIKSAGADSQAVERRKILESDEWRRANRAFNEWLSVQQVYRPEEVATIKAEMRSRIEHMSPRELRDFLEDMERRLDVLLSAEAEDARQWLKQFVAVVRHPEQKIGRNRPDVLNMTASQIRQEILWLQQHREGRQQAQSAFDRSRQMQWQFARDQRNARQASRQATDRSNWPANTPIARSPYLPQREIPPRRPSPVYMIGSGGTVYFRTGQ